MQPPRHTSEFKGEFCDDSGLSKRQPRQTQRPTVAPSPRPSSVGGMKYSTRQSRLRAPSLERQTMLAVPGSVSKTGTARATPLRNTPLGAQRPPGIQRALFTAERTGGAPHNDKKWVQEQMQRVNDYLNEMVPRGSIPGIGADFFASGTGLRQMSIKQFVGIINFFLQFIWRSRYTVGANHVEDITQILQKLNYPYQVNKSWLMTPNVQHSFPHVIVLLDFLKDFAPPSPSELQRLEAQNAGAMYMDPFKFPLADEPMQQSQNASNVASMSLTSQTLAMDTQFHAQLIQSAEDGFQLWDKQLTDEYTNLKQITCSLLIRKRCDLQDSASLDADIARLQQELDNWEAQMPAVPEHDEERHAHLRAQERHARKQLECCINDLHELQQKRSLLSNQRQTIDSEIHQLNACVETLQQTVNTQRYNVKQRDGFIEEINQLKHQLQVHERVVHDLQQRNLNQQVLLSRCKKKLTDELERFNALMRELHYSGALSVDRTASIACNTENSSGDGADDELDLELPLQPNLQLVKERVRKLERIRAQLVQHQRNMHKRRMHLELKLNELNTHNKTELEPTIIKLGVQLQSNEQRLQNFETNSKHKHSEWSKQMAKLEEETLLLSAKYDQLQDEYKTKMETLREQQQKLEKIMCETENEHSECVTSRHKFLDQYDEVLTAGEQELRTLESLTQCNETHMQLLMETFQLNSGAELSTAVDVSLNEEGV